MRRPRVAFGPALALLALAGPSASAQPFAPAAPAPARVEFLDVGQGDAILIRAPEGQAALVDAGPSDTDVLDRLRERGVKQIDLVVVTHHHSDHYGGMDAVLRAYRPKFFLATASSHNTPQYLRLLELVQKSKIPVLRPTAAARPVQMGSVKLTILPQPPLDKQHEDDENDNSIGLRVDHGDVSILLTGDSEKSERAWWTKHCPDLLRHCEVLKLAHHGSHNGTDAAWLGLVKPRLAVASLGAGNDYGHPHKETLAALKAAGVPLLRTDQDGTVVITSDGRSWSIAKTPTSPRAPPADGRHAGHSKTGHKPRPADREGHRSSGEGTGRIDLNRASQEELESLPGIGETLAKRIIEGRPYRHVEDLLDVKGIGKGHLSEIKSRVAVD